MVMLSLFQKIAPRLDLEISVGHVDHALREFSADDAQFVRKYCDQHDLHSFLERVDVTTRMEEKHESVEMAARYLRYEALEAMRMEVGADYVATAHTASDQAETVLLRVLQGTGIHGLQGIRESRDHLIRPLLIFERRELWEYAQTHQVPYREDPSNRDTAIARNWLRHVLLPEIREHLNPAVTGALNRLAMISAETTESLENEAEKALEEVVTERSKEQIILDLRKCQTYFTAILKTIFINCLADLGASVHSLTFPIMEQLEQVARTGGSGLEMRLPGGITVMRDRDYLLFSKGKPWSDFSAEFQEQDDILLGSFRCISSIDMVPDPKQLYRKDEWSASFDRETLQSLELRWRNWQDGDWMHLGSGSTKKVSDIFIDTKTPVWEKHQIPLLVIKEDAVLWIPGIKRSARAWVNETSNEMINITVVKES